MARLPLRREVSQRLAVRRPGRRRIEPTLEQNARCTEGSTGEGRDLQCRGLLAVRAHHGELGPVGRECRLTAIVRLSGQWLRDRQRAALIVDTRVHRGRRVDRMPNEEEASTRERNGADVAAGVIVGVGQPAGLRLCPVERHAPYGQVDAVRLGAIEAVHDVGAVGGDPRIEGPVVQVDVSRIILGEALQDVAAKIQQIEVARKAAPHDRDQPRVIGRQGWL